MPTFADTIKFVMQAGPYIWLQFALAWVIVFLTIMATILVMLRRGKRAARLRTLIDAILFWGCLTAVLGFLGQWSGLHRASKAVFDHGVVDPQLVILGLGESLSTTVFGMFTLVIAGFLWYGLRAAQSWKAAM